MPEVDAEPLATLVSSCSGGWAALLADARTCKSGGDVSDVLWRTIVFTLGCMVLIPIPWVLRWYAEWYVSQVELAPPRKASFPRGLRWAEALGVEPAEFLKLPPASGSGDRGITTEPSR